MKNQEGQIAQDGTYFPSSIAPAKLEHSFAKQPRLLARILSDSSLSITPIRPLVNGVQDKAIVVNRPSTPAAPKPQAVKPIPPEPLNPIAKAMGVPVRRSLTVNAPTGGATKKSFGKTTETWGGGVVESPPKRSILSTLSTIFKFALFFSAIFSAGFFGSRYRKEISEFFQSLKSSLQAKSETPASVEEKPATIIKAEEKPIIQAEPKVAKVEPKIETKTMPIAVEAKPKAEAAPAPIIKPAEVIKPKVEAKPSPQITKLDWTIPVPQKIDVLGVKIAAAKKEILGILKIYPNNKDVEVVVKSIFDRLGGNNANAIDFDYIGKTKKDEKGNIVGTFVKFLNRDLTTEEKSVEEIKKNPGDILRITSAITGGLTAVAFADYAGKAKEVEAVMDRISIHLIGARSYFNNFRIDLLNDVQKEKALQTLIPNEGLITEVAKALKPDDKSGVKEQVERAVDPTQPTINPEFLKRINMRINSVKSTEQVDKKSDNLSAILDRGPLSLKQLIEITKQERTELELI